MNEIIQEQNENYAELIEENTIIDYVKLANECKSYNEFHKKSGLTNEQASPIWMDKCLK